MQQAQNMQKILVVEIFYQQRYTSYQRALWQPHDGLTGQYLIDR